MARRQNATSTEHERSAGGKSFTSMHQFYKDCVDDLGFASVESFLFVCSPCSGGKMDDIKLGVQYVIKSIENYQLHNVIRLGGGAVILLLPE